MIWYDMVMQDELILRHANNNNSNTSQLKTRQDKVREDKTWLNIYRFITYNHNDNDNDNTMTMTMTIIIQWIVMAWR